MAGVTIRMSRGLLERVEQARLKLKGQVGQVERSDLLRHLISLGLDKLEQNGGRTRG